MCTTNLRNIAGWLDRPIVAGILSLALTTNGVVSSVFGQDAKEMVATKTPAVTQDVSLVKMWSVQAAVGQSKPIPVGVSLWPDRSSREQFVTVYVGSRLVQKFSADDMDRAAYEKQLLASGSIGGFAFDSVPVLGLDGAKAQADKLVEQLKILGKSPKVEVTDRSKYYLVVTSADGTVSVGDAESGRKIWTAKAGNSHLPTLPAGVNDDVVAVVNGLTLYVYDLKSGNLVQQIKSKITPAGGPQPVGDWIHLPGLNGELRAYNYKNPDGLFWSHKNNGTSQFPAVSSNDRAYVAWVANRRFLNLAKSERRAEIWNRFESQSEIAAPPLPVNGGFVIAALNGTVSYVGTPANPNIRTRQDGLLWTFGSGCTLTQTPVADDEAVAFVSASNQLNLISIKDGRPIWERPLGGVSQALCISKHYVYARSINGQLEMIDRNSGVISKVLPIQFHRGYQNSVNDRIILISENGSMACLRENVNVEPVAKFEGEIAAMLSESGLEAVDGPATTDTPADAMGTPGSNPFDGGGDIFGGSDPLMGGASSADDDIFGSDIFGGG